MRPCGHTVPAAWLLCDHAQLATGAYVVRRRPAADYSWCVVGRFASLAEAGAFAAEQRAMFPAQDVEVQS